MKRSLIQEKSFDFALRVIDLYKILIAEDEYVIARQLLKSGTSIGANVWEATMAQSRRDFIHKMSIASKEAKETLFWLELLKESQLVEGDYGQYLEDANAISKILVSIVKTSQERTL
ncbi:MAG: four helix bundle protein [Saprospiraceae bacterium]|nr:four helix bundle protein [Saprospiraceae bacterium]